MLQLSRNLTQIFSSSTTTMKVSNSLESYRQMDAGTLSIFKLAYMGLINIFWLLSMVSIECFTHLEAIY